MREIKFRQALFVNGKFHDWHYWGFLDGGFHGVDAINSLRDAQVNSMQFTGLHDRNGKEIYEGDVVEFTAYTRFHEHSEDRTEVVIYSCDPNGRVGFTPMVWHTDVEDGHYNYEIENIRVIGNIYANPELIGEQR